MQRVRAQVDRHGHGRSYTFVTDRRGELVESGRLTFAELDARARSIGAWLADRGMADRTALLLHPAGLEFLGAFLGCLYARVVAVPSPLPRTDPRALERAEKIIRDAGVRLVLTGSADLAMLGAWLREAGLDGTVECVATDALDLPDPGDWRQPEIGPGTLAYLQYTSGSTSEPRGVMITHANLLHNEREIWRAIGSPREGVGAGWLPHYHDMGLVGMLLQPVYAGGDLYFASPIAFVMRPALWLEMIDRYRAEYTVAPDFAYDWCATRVTDAQVAGLDLSGLRFALNGAEPVRTGTLRAMVRRFGAAGFSEKAWAPAYGMAEATLVITATPLGHGPLVRRFDAAALERHEAVPVTGPEPGAEPGAEPGPEPGPGPGPEPVSVTDPGPVPSGDSVPDPRLGSGVASPQAPGIDPEPHGGRGVELVGCGRPISMSVRVVDPGSGAELPDGRVGELWVRGESVAQGYWRCEEATRDAFGGHTASGDGPFLRTGDLGFLLDGELYVTGRIKDVVIVNGRNLYPQDLEEAARRVHPSLGAAAAFGVRAGDEHVVLVQEVRGRGLDVPAGELARGVQGTLAGAFGLPSMSVALVERGGVGKTTSGKIQRSRTRDLLLGGALPVVHAEFTAAVAARVRLGTAARVPSWADARVSSEGA
ncbi:fatty acyl-AMP ligase [Streptosporangium sp. DT93]|uniref:fatty acyl-AMP ligase n=1 Tax=Streptosporangium sp. DT93 TaxID=3393428 RepID=UPI003CEC0C93